MQQDSIQRFLFEKHNVRGEIVRLRESFQTIMEQHQYPAEINLLLGQALLSVVLMIDAVKFKGQLTLQFSGNGALKMLVAKCTSQSAIRGLAQWEEGASVEALRQSFDAGQLVVTFERDDSVNPHQSIVPLDKGSIAKSLEFYFLQSEQLPTRFYLNVKATDGFGIMLQSLPSENQDSIEIIADLMHRIEKFSSLGSLELDNAELLQQIFPDEDIRLFDAHKVVFACSCSVVRSENAVRTFGLAEVEDILKEKPYVVVNCEYCNKDYSFDKEDIRRIFDFSTKAEH